MSAWSWEVANVRDWGEPSGHWSWCACVYNPSRLWSTTSNTTWRAWIPSPVSWNDWRGFPSTAPLKLPSLSRDACFCILQSMCDAHKGCFQLAWPTFMSSWCNSWAWMLRNPCTRSSWGWHQFLCATQTDVKIVEVGCFCTVKSRQLGPLTDAETWVLKGLWRTTFGPSFIIIRSTFS